MRFTLILFTALIFTSCAKQEDAPHAMLSQFVEAYIHDADPKAALSFTVGDATEKLNGEIAAVAGQERPSSGPDVEYAVIHEEMSHDSVTFELELKIKSSGTPAFTRDLLVMGTPVNGTWKVVDFFFLK